MKCYLNGWLLFLYDFKHCCFRILWFFYWCFFCHCFDTLNWQNKPHWLEQRINFIPVFPFEERHFLPNSPFPEMPLFSQAVCVVPVPLSEKTTFYRVTLYQKCKLPSWTNFHIVLKPIRLLYVMFETQMTFHSGPLLKVSYIKTLTHPKMYQEIINESIWFKQFNPSLF